MAYIRLIHRFHYSPRKSRFSHLAFKDDGGISVVDFDCGIRTSGSICGHVEQFYSNYDSPTIFWTIPEGRISARYPFVQDDSESGDVCHHNIEGMPQTEAEETAHAIPLDEVSICENGLPRQITRDDLPPNPYPPI